MLAEFRKVLEEINGSDLDYIYLEPEEDEFLDLNRVIDLGVIEE